MRFYIQQSLLIFLALLIIACQTTPIKLNTVAGSISSAKDASQISAEELNALVGPLLPDGSIAPYNPQCEHEQRIYFFTADLPGLSIAVELNKFLVRELQPIYVDRTQSPNLTPCVKNPYWIAPTEKRGE